MYIVAQLTVGNATADIVLSPNEVELLQTCSLERVLTNLRQTEDLRLVTPLASRLWYALSANLVPSAYTNLKVQLINIPTDPETARREVERVLKEGLGIEVDVKLGE